MSTPHPPILNVDLHWAARAIDLAREADYRTSPNPMVGAVVLDDSGALVGEGHHRQAGGPHAEQEALEAAGNQARGGTLYVNLEPCTHTHRNPSCVEAVIRAGVRRVVVSMADPDQRVRGAGIEVLRSAGIETVLGVNEDSARRLNEFYIKHRLTGRPFVTAKFAVSLDGKIATQSGDSRWISSPESRAHSHRLRHSHDAILVGVGTVLADDPELSARLEDFKARQPVRVILDSKLRTPHTAKVVGLNTVVATTLAGEVGDAETVVLPRTAEGRVALGPLLDELGSRGILSLLVEGGATVHGAFFAEGLVDKVHAYIAPIVIGGTGAPGPVGGEGIQRLGDATRLRDVEMMQIGGDLLMVGYVDVHRDS